MACKRSDLVFIHGFDPGTTAEELENFMKAAFPGNLQRLWLDPFKKPRAVAHLSDEFDEGQLQEKCETNAFHGKVVFMDCSDETSSIFVQTHMPEMKAVRDKLYWRLQKQPVRSSIVNIAPLEDSACTDCFLVEFAEGWAAVLRACDKEWTLEGVKLTVQPHFRGFKEELDLQSAALLHKHNTKSGTNVTGQSNNLSDTTAENTFSMKPEVQRKPSAETTKEKNVRTTLCLEPVFVLLLDSLHFRDDSVQVTFDPDAGEISIHGPSDLVHRMADLLASESEKFEEDEHMIEFLQQSKEIWQGKLATTTTQVFLESESTKPKQLLVLSSSEKVPLLDYMMELKKNQCVERVLENENELNSTPINDESTSHMTIKDPLQYPAFIGNDSLHQDLVSRFQDVKNKDNRDHANSDSSDDLENAVEKFDYFLSLHRDQVQFVQRYMSEDIKQIENYFRKHNCKISFEYESIKITSDSQESARYQVPKDLKELIKKIQVIKKPVDFPGLGEFCRSPEGMHVISELCEKHQCLMVPQTGSNPDSRSPNQDDQSLYGDTERLLSVPMLGQATNMGWYRLFILQCQPNDINIKMKICFVHESHGDKCTIKTTDNSYTLNILLPPLHKSIDIERQKTSLQRCILIVIKQMKTLKEKKITLYFEVSQACTGKIEFPFPVDIVAEVLIQTLQESGKDNNMALDFFLCEPSKEAIVKAFIFHLPSYVAVPNSQIWEDISFFEQQEFPNYGLIRQATDVEVRVESSLPSFGMIDWDVRCTPFDITEDGTMMFESLNMYHQNAARKIESLVKQNPELLELNKAFFENDSPFLFYCSQAWGFDIDKAILGSIDQCLMYVHEMDHVYLVPPCLTQSNQSVRYVARKVFLCLDDFLKAFQPDGYKRCIHLIIKDKDHRKVYEEELKHRCPKQEKSIFQKLANYFSPEPQVSENQHSKTMHTALTYKSPRADIKIIGAVPGEIQLASKELNETLEKLYKTRTVKLSSKETKVLEDFLRKGDVIVDVNGQKHFDLKKNKKKNKKKKNRKTQKCELSGSTLKFKGYSDVIVDNFIETFRQLKSEENREERDDERGASSNTDQGTNKGSKNQTPMNDEEFSKNTREDLATNEVSQVANDSSDDCTNTVEQSVENSDSEASGGVSQQQWDMTSGIIQQEELSEGPASLKIHDTWQGNKPFSLVKLDKVEMEYRIVATEVSKDAYYNLDIMRIERVENKELYSRWSSKKEMVGEETIMWHHVSRENKREMCEHGFVQNDKAAKVFYDKISSCISGKDKGEDIYLARVLVLKDRQGKTSERNSGGQCMVSSVAQAYPSHLLSVHVEDEEDI